jgi:hypothetical protein
MIGYPSSSRPILIMKHIDGPLLTFRDGQIHWLTLRERFRVWMGWEDALSLERRLRPDLDSCDE